MAGLGDDLDVFASQRDFDGIDDDLAKFQQDVIVKEALQKGVDLRIYSQQIETDLKLSEDALLESYLKEGDHFSELHFQIKSCDTILERMEKMLSDFQGNLGAISSEIEHLQERSMSLSTKLTNRQAAEEKLSSIVRGLHVSEEVINAISTGEINDEFVKALRLLSERIKFLERPEVSYTRAAGDVSTVVERLRLKAISRIRTHLLGKFNELRAPKTNIQVKQRLLLRSKYLYDFVAEFTRAATAAASSPSVGASSFSSSSSSSSSSMGMGMGSHPLGSSSSSGAEGVPDIANELRSAYVEVVRPLYANTFKAYLSSIKKLQSDPLATKYDLLGMEEGKTGGLFSSKRTNEQILKALSLGARDAVLSETGAESMMRTQADLASSTPSATAAAASSAGTYSYLSFGSFLASGSSATAVGKHAYERLFASAQRLLMDAATTEHDFVTEFFAEPAATTAAAGDDSGTPTWDSSTGKLLFSQVFSKTLSLYLEDLEDHLFASHDALQILLCIRLTHRHNHEMQLRRCHCLDSFFDRVNMTLWPRFKAVFDANVESVRGVKAPALSASSASADPTSLHFVTQRYAAFASGLARLNQPYRDEILMSNLRRLRDEMERLLLRFAAILSPPKHQGVYLLNSYHFIVRTILAVLPAGAAAGAGAGAAAAATAGAGAGAGGADMDDVTYFQERILAQTTIFVEEELSDKLGKMITFVKDMEWQLSEKAKSSSSSVPALPSGASLDQQVEAILRHFHSYWRDIIEQMQASVDASFPQAVLASSSTGSPAAALGEDRKGDADEAGAADNEILKRVLIQMVLYYERFTKIVKQLYGGRFPSFAKDLLVLRQTIMYELKKYGQR